MVTQIHEFKSFLTQLTSSSGKGPCCLTHEKANRATQICAAKAYAAEGECKSTGNYAIRWCKAQACED